MSFAKIYLPAMCLFWAGLLFGVSFLATPVKFQAPSLELPVALDVGRYTFLWLNKLEIGMALILAALLWKGTRSVLVRLGGGAVIAWVAAKALWAIPVLDARTETVIQGSQPAPSPVHSIYIACDLAELILLLALGFATLYAHARGPRAEVRYS